MMQYTTLRATKGAKNNIGEWLFYFQIVSWLILFRIGISPFPRLALPQILAAGSQCQMKCKIWIRI